MLEPTANEATFRQFVDTILARKPIELSTNDNDEADESRRKNRRALKIMLADFCSKSLLLV